MNVDKETLEKLYIDDGLIMKTVGERLGIATGTVFNLMKKYGIKSRPSGWGKGFHHTQETKDKLSAMFKGRTMSDETRLKLSESKRIGGIGHKKTRRDGYISIYFPDHPRSNKSGYIMEHILVMESLVGRWLDDGEVVHHINHNRSDNRKENLQLMSVSEHMSIHTKERHENGAIKHFTKPVRNKETGEVFNSIREAAKKYELKPTNISRACKTKSRKAGGFSWEYVKERGDDLLTQ